MKHICCPICYGPSAQVLEQYTLNVDAGQRGAGEHQQVGGLQIFKCSNAHIFFLRSCDVGAEERCFRAAA